MSFSMNEIQSKIFLLPTIKTQQQREQKEKRKSKKNNFPKIKEFIERIVAIRDIAIFIDS